MQPAGDPGQAREQRSMDLEEPYSNGSDPQIHCSKKQLVDEFLLSAWRSKALKLTQSN